MLKILKWKHQACQLIFLKTMKIEKNNCEAVVECLLPNFLSEFIIITRIVSFFIKKCVPQDSAVQHKDSHGCNTYVL